MTKALTYLDLPPLQPFIFADDAAEEIRQIGRHGYAGNRSASS